MGSANDAPGGQPGFALVCPSEMRKNFFGFRFKVVA
jgi:hypothetical protein